MSDSLKQTSLYSDHIKLGAKMVPFAGFEMPIMYQSLKDEALAVRKAVGVFDVSHMGEFFLKGDIQDFAHLFTNPLSNYSVGKAMYALMCNDQGGIIDDVIVYRLEEKLTLICVNASNIQKDEAWILKHIDQKRVSFENASSHYSLLAIQGPESFAIIHKLIPSLHDKEFAAYEVYQTGEIIFASTGYTGEKGGELFIPNSLISKYFHACLELGVRPCGLGARDVLRLEAGYPLYGNELNEQLSPLECGLGRFVGKEHHYLGKDPILNNKTLRTCIKLIVEDAIPRSGHPVEIQGLGVIGEVTSGTYSPHLEKGIAFASVEKEKFSKDSNLYINIRGNLKSAQLCSKSFLTTWKRN